jgi:hypothetical protein
VKAPEQPALTPVQEVTPMKECSTRASKSESVVLLASRCFRRMIGRDRDGDRFDRDRFDRPPVTCVRQIGLSHDARDPVSLRSVRWFRGADACDWFD